MCVRVVKIKSNGSTKYVELSVECFWTRVRFPPAPPLFEIPTLIGWDFFCPKPQCWRGFRPLPRARHLRYRASFCTLAVSLLAVFSVCLARAFDTMSCIHAGLRGVGC